MYLSGLEILGFKSFPVKTSVEFAAGITGVVGPNGCGKTNVLDSIRWVLGEQRISILRGGKMEDVIFAGTREMKPLGMAEVSLHIVNNRGVLPTEYNNITITRRLHRSGDSEYLLNNVACRLKDINELFADTGMGANAYSVIELDMVEAILSDKADQRRMLFEEAAGITKYKHRKKAALRKLEATEQDLLRLLDILGEVSSQVNSLSRQMKRAERYKYYEDRVKTVGQVILKEKYRRLHGQLQKVRDEKRLGQIKMAELSAEIDRWEIAREDYSTKSLELSEQLRGVRAQIEEASSNCYRLETEISVTEERIHSAETNDQNDRRDIENIGVKLEQLAQEKITLNEKTISLNQSLAEARAALEQSEIKLNEKLAQLEQARNSTQNQQRDLFEIEGRRNLTEQTRTQLGEQINEINVQLAKIRERDGLLDSEYQEATGRLEQLEARQQKTRDEIAFLEQSVISFEADRETTNARLVELQASLNSRSVEQSTMEAQAELLTRMIAHYEGYGSGVTSVFSERETLPGIIDTAANLIQTKPEYVAAIETALGDAAEYIVVENRSAARQAINHLREQKRGRATFIIKSELDSWSKDHKIARPGGFGGNLVHAAEVITATPGYEKLADLLLGDVVIVNDQTSAEKLIGLGQGEFRVVTLDGHYYPARQIHTGGGDKQMPLLGRESDLTRLKTQIAELAAETQSIREEIERWGQHKTQIESNLTETTRLLSELRNTAGELQIDSAGIRLRTQQITDSRREFGSETVRLTEKVSSLDAQLNELEVDVTRLTADTEGKKSSLESQHSTVESLQQDVNSSGREVEDLRLRAIRLQT
ncbi:MAG: chromosome segregation protein SMC, partial [Candidatus Zixiibacteriota bacterium]